MEIIGYSERGAMNALFYEMALKYDEDEMRKFLQLANFNDSENYTNFKLYLEFSLSTFGSPDLVITANKDEERVVFFVEAKVSECHGYRVDTIIKGKDKDTSNLIYQLKQKQAFFDSRQIFPDKAERFDKIIHTKMGYRKIGNHPIVRSLVDEIKGCSIAEYIAIVPKMNNVEKLIDEVGIDKLKIVFWENIYEKFNNYEILKATIIFNQSLDPETKSKKVKSQILNNPLPND